MIFYFFLFFFCGGKGQGMSKLLELESLKIAICSGVELQLSGPRTFDDDHDHDHGHGQTRPSDRPSRTDNHRQPKPVRARKPRLQDTERQTHPRLESLFTTKEHGPEPERKRRPRTKLNETSRRTLSDKTRTLTQSLLPFGKHARVSIGFDFASRSLEAFKYSLETLGLVCMRFSKQGLELTGQKGCGFLSQDMFHAYPLSQCSDNQIKTEFDVLNGFVQKRKHFDLNVTDSVLECCGSSRCSLLTIPRRDIDIDINVDTATDCRTALGPNVVPALGHRIGRPVYTSSFGDFFHTCSTLGISNATLKFEQESTSLCADLAGSSLLVKLEHCRQQHEPPPPPPPPSRPLGLDALRVGCEFQVQLAGFNVLTISKTTDFFSVGTSLLLVRFHLGGDSFVCYQMQASQVL